MLDIVRAMFPVGEVASYDSGRQQIFGLEDIYDKRLLLFPDIPARLYLVLHEDKMCTMVSGESLCKNKTALEVPALLAGNHIPSYKDVVGRIVRWFLIFPFNTLIQHKDTTLKSRILRDELPKIILNCLACYHTMREQVGKGQLRSCLPDTLKAGGNEIRIET